MQLDDDVLTVLHISDAHIGQPDERNEMNRIINALLTASHGQELVPDLCIFSGDLSYSGDKNQFDAGTEWLSKLLEPWPNTALFVVPGNHDVARGQANLILRHAFETEQAFAERRESLVTKLHHLANFFDFHSSLKTRFGSRVLSDWTNPFGCQGQLQNAGRPIRLIGLNTSLLSCHNDDERKLVQDITTLNGFLGEGKASDECAIAIGHHPLGWLAPWNHEAVERLLRQEAGVNLYLHGHRHEQSAVTFATGRGDSLCVLESGAAYQGSQWPQYFSFYNLQFSRRDILPAIYLYSDGSGKWVKDNTRSEPFVAPLPPPRMQRTTSGRADNAFPETREVECLEESPTRPIKKAFFDEAVEEQEKIELDAFRVRNSAMNIYGPLKIYMDSSLVRAGQLYVHSSRVKDLESIKQKVLKRIREGQVYSVADVEDVVGFRYCTLFQSDLPAFITALLNAAFGWEKRDRIFRHDKGAKVTIHTSRPERDPLTVVEATKKVFEDWGGHHSLEVRSRSTGYSSIHIVLWHVANRWSDDQDGMPVEFQLRSGLEEFWGRLDHILRYEANRGEAGGDLWERHLNVLKAQFDAAIQYLDVIKDALEKAPVLRARKASPAGETTRKSRSRGSFSKTGAQLERLAGLADEILHQVRAAFVLWEEADASRQFGGDPRKFHLAADAFHDLTRLELSAETGSELRTRFEYIVRMERAYMLLGCDEFEAAQAIYTEVIEKFPSDAAALVRQGQVQEGLKKIDEAISYFERALNGGSLSEWASELPVVLDFARLHRALCFFRAFEKVGESFAVKRNAIKLAITQSLELLKTTADDIIRGQALNNVVYYAWEEREFLRESGTAPELSDKEFFALGRRLVKELADDVPSFRQADTLARTHLALGDEQAAIAQAKTVCLLLEEAAKVRSGGIEGLEALRFTNRWILEVLEWLTEGDESDALLFCVNLLNGRSPGLPKPNYEG
jgi:ppGpp synthetase/RelA/SpoT-type nucleotidyltranferase/3',5'-cyclic AMP phosphodiesterase CpdA